MKFTPIPLDGAFVIELEPVADARGFFARTFDRDEFERRGLETAYPQHSLSFNERRGTLRGLHYQAEPDGETKIVRCVGGAVHDVVVDLRAGSATFRRWFGTELSSANRRALYVPRGFAHGFLTLTDHAEVLYQISAAYRPEAARGVRWDDPAFGIRWPQVPSVMSDRDRTFADFPE